MYSWPQIDISPNVLCLNLHDFSRGFTNPVGCRLMSAPFLTSHLKYPIYNTLDFSGAIGVTSTGSLGAEASLVFLALNL